MSECLILSFGRGDPPRFPLPSTLARVAAASLLVLGDAILAVCSAWPLYRWDKLVDPVVTLRTRLLILPQ